MSIAKYPQASMHIKTHKYLVDRLRAKADKQGVKFSVYMTELLINVMEDKISDLQNENEKLKEAIKALQNQLDYEREEKE